MAQATGDADVRAARRRGEEYLLERNLFRRRSTGEVAVEAFRQFSFPARWFYDVLRSLDYFRAAGDPPDERMAEALQLVRDKQQPDGTWLLENTHAGDVHVELEDGDGLASRWNTLRVGGTAVGRWQLTGLTGPVGTSARHRPLADRREAPAQWMAAERPVATAQKATAWMTWSMMWSRAAGGRSRSDPLMSRLAIPCAADQAMYSAPGRLVAGIAPLATCGVSEPGRSP